MSKLAHTPVFIWLSFLLILLIWEPVLSADYSKNISEEYLRSQFTFGPGDRLKYSQCKNKTYPTCIYIWGAESKKDATRAKYGLLPDGNKLQIVYAQAKSPKDFERVTATYSDVEKIDGIGAEAVWSEKRKQLSFITTENFIVHVNIDKKQLEDPRGKAVFIAEYLLKNL